MSDTKSLIRYSSIFAGLLLGILPARADVLEVDLKYDRYPDREANDDTFRPHGYVSLEKSTKVPPGKWKLPELKSKVPVYALARLGDERRLLILDRKKAGDSFFNLLHFDSNGNGDLTDDRAVEVPKPEEELEEGPILISENIAEFPVVDTRVKINGKEVPYAFRVAAVFPGWNFDEKTDREGLEEQLMFYCSSSCCYRGEVKLEGQEYRVLLGDGNANGRFDDIVSVRKQENAAPLDPLYPQGDQFFLIKKEKDAEVDMSYFGNLLQIKNSFYRVSVDLAARKLRLIHLRDEALGGLVEVKLNMAVERMTLHSEDGKHGVMLYQPGRNVRLPEGRYRFTEYQALRKDREGDLWSISARVTSKTPFLAVGGGAPEVLAFGEPFLAAAAVPENAYVKYANEGELAAVPLQFRLLGGAREAVVDLRRIQGKKTRIPMSESKSYRPKEPSYRIAKLTGEMVAQGAFSYG